MGKLNNSPFLLSALTVGMGALFLFVVVNLALSRGTTSMLVIISVGLLMALWFFSSEISLARILILLFPLIVLSPPIRIANNFPAIFGNEPVIFLVGLFLLVGSSSNLRDSETESLHPLGIMLALFIPLIALSMIMGYIGFNIVPSRGDMFEFVKMLKFVLAFYIASQVVLSGQVLRAIVMTVILVIGISALLGVAQALDLVGSRGFFIDIYRESPNADTLKSINTLRSRASGTIGNPNSFGLIVATGLMFSIAYFRSGIFSRGTLYFLALISLIFMFAILASGSRTALLAAVLGVSYLLMREFWSKGYSLSDTVESRKLPLIVGAAALIIVSLAMLPVTDQLLGQSLSRRMDRITDFRFSDVSSQSRIDLIGTALSQAKYSPVLGYGPAETESGFLGSNDIDNEILKLLILYGIVGVILAFLFWYKALRVGFSLTRQNMIEQRVFGEAIIAVILVNLVGIIFAGALLDPRRMTLTAILLGVAVAAGRLESSDVETEGELKLI